MTWLDEIAADEAERDRRIVEQLGGEWPPGPTSVLCTRPHSQLFHGPHARCPDCGERLELHLCKGCGLVIEESGWCFSCWTGMSA